MNYNKTVFATGLLAASLMVAGSPILAEEGRITKAEKAELHHDRREVRGDRREIRHDRKEIGDDRREFRRDAKDALKN